MSFFSKYPYTDFHELNIDALIKEINELKIQINNFVNLNTIKYADPIQWNITTQYEANTVVIDPISGTAYISTHPVPAGVSLSNTDYWTVVFTLDVLSANQNITFRNDGTNVVATFTSDTGDWLLWNSELYKVTQPIALNTAYVVGFNLQRYSVENFIDDYVTALQNEIGDLSDLDTTAQDNIVDAINELVGIINLLTYSQYATPELYGAAGDGVTDDTAAVQSAFSQGFAVCKPGATYLITDTINLVDNTNIIGNGATIKVKDNVRIDNALLKGDDIKNVIIKDLIIDMNMQNMPVYTENRVTYYNIGAYFIDSEDIDISGCKFINLYNQSIVFYRCGGVLDVKDNYFASPVQYQGQCAEHVVFQTIGEGVTANVQNNLMDNEQPSNPAYGVCGVTAEGCWATLDISNNTLIYCGRNNVHGHRLCPIDLYGNNKNASIHHNYVTSTHMFIRLDCASDISVTDNIFEDVSNAADPANESYIWITWGNRYATMPKMENIVLKNNKFIAKGTKEGALIGIWNSTSGSTVKLKHIVIENNILESNSNYAVILVDGFVDDLYVADNYIEGVVLGIAYTEPISTAAITAYHHTYKNNRVYASVSNAIRATQTATNVTIDGLVFEGNMLQSTAENMSINKPALLIGNRFNSGIYDTVTGSEYTYATGNVFASGVATPFNSATLVHKNNFKGTTIFDS